MYMQACEGNGPPLSWRPSAHAVAGRTEMPEITRTAAEVAAMLEDGKEIAFLDVREIVPFGTGHPLLATHLALGYIECGIAGLVPRRDTRVIITDGG
jgi:hypothetical protein